MSTRELRLAQARLRAAATHCRQQRDLHPGDEPLRQALTRAAITCEDEAERIERLLVDANRLEDRLRARA